MMKIRSLFLLAFGILFVLNSLGQKLKYKDYKNDFSVRDYRDSLTLREEVFSPFNAGMLNLLVPSSGYFYVEEPKRGLCVLGIELIPISVAFYGFAMSFGDGPGNIHGGEKLFNYGLIAYELIQIWSVFDVVKIAKIKNLAYQDRKITMKINPDFQYVNQNGNSHFINGLSLCLYF